MRRSALALIPTLLLAGAPGQAAPPDARAVLDRVERRQLAVDDLTARFAQTYRSGMLGRELRESGTVWLKRPGRMLWQYEKPEKKTFVSDGKQYFFYVPADRQVIVRDQAGDKGLPGLLLSQRTRLSEHFEATAEEPPGPGRHRLVLVPRKPDPDVQRVVLDVDAEGRIRAIDVVDAQGNRSVFTFDEIRENVGVPERMFRFETPSGVEVVRG